MLLASDGRVWMNLWWTILQWLIYIIGTPEGWPTHAISNDLIGRLTCIHVYMLNFSWLGMMWWHMSVSNENGSTLGLTQMDLLSVFLLIPLLSKQFPLPFFLSRPSLRALFYMEQPSATVSLLSVSISVSFSSLLQTSSSSEVGSQLVKNLWQALCIVGL